MFTGIIESMGKVAAMTPKGGDVTLLIKSEGLDFTDVQLGDSIAVNGVCLTATALPGGAFEGGCVRGNPVVDLAGANQRGQHGESGKSPDAVFPAG